MKLRRLRFRLAILFGVVTAALAIGPLLLWHSARAEAIRDDFDVQLLEQMEYAQLAVYLDDREEIYWSTWYVNEFEEYSDALYDSDLEPPLFTWVSEAGSNPEFRDFSLDSVDTYRAYIRPLNEGEALVTVAETGERNNDLSSLKWRTVLTALGLGVASFGLGWVGAGLALGPTKRIIDAQQGFLADAAHEMRTPLAVIMASSSQALSRERSSEEYVRSLSEIRSAAERASTGVNELLDLVRFDSGQAIPRLAPLRLDLLAEEVAASVRSEDSVVVAEPGDPVIVDADMALLRQALDNVVRNAVRRAERVELTSLTEGRYGVVQITDDGPGFDESKLGSVFDRYQRGDTKGEAGIGLSIVKAIVEANGGDVSASNKDTGGAVITIRIPLADTLR